MTYFDHFLVLAFAILYPTYVFFGYHRIKNDLIANKPGVRVRDYKETIAWLWLLGALALVNWIYQGRSLLDLGLGFPTAWPAWTGLLVVALISVFMWLQVRKLRDDEDQRRALAGQLDKGSVSEFLPRSKQELTWFLHLSVAAGVCEEILFRGFLLWYLLHFSAPVAIVLSSIAFGFAHSYQGWQGILRTGLMGLILALAYVFTGSLWVPIFFHIAADIYSGTLGRLAYAEDPVNSSNG